MAQQLQLGQQQQGGLGPAFAMSAGFTPAPAYEHLYSADGLPMQGGR